MKRGLYLRAVRQRPGSSGGGVVPAMGLHPRFLSWIGILGIVVGIWLLDNPPEGDLLPVNQALLALDSALITILIFASLMRGRG